MNLNLDIFDSNIVFLFILNSSPVLSKNVIINQKIKKNAKLIALKYTIFHMISDLIKFWKVQKVQIKIWKYKI